jgi:hypothetical protein
MFDPIADLMCTSLPFGCCKMQIFKGFGENGQKILQLDCKY